MTRTRLIPETGKITGAWPMVGVVVEGIFGGIMVGAYSVGERF